MDALQYWHRFKSKIFFFIKYFWTSVALSLSLPRFLQLINLCIVVRYILQLILVHLSHTLMCFTKCRTLPCSAGEWLLRMPLSTVTCYQWTCLPVEYFKRSFWSITQLLQSFVALVSTWYMLLPSNSTWAYIFLKISEVDEVKHLLLWWWPYVQMQQPVAPLILLHFCYKVWLLLKHALPTIEMHSSALEKEVWGLETSGKERQGKLWLPQEELKERQHQS